MRIGMVIYSRYLTESSNEIFILKHLMRQFESKGWMVDILAAGNNFSSQYDPNISSIRPHIVEIDSRGKSIVNRFFHPQDANFYSVSKNLDFHLEKLCRERIYDCLILWHAPSLISLYYSGIMSHVPIYLLGSLMTFDAGMNLAAAHVSNVRMVPYDPAAEMYLKSLGLKNIVEGVNLNTLSDDILTAQGTASLENKTDFVLIARTTESRKTGRGLFGEFLELCRKGKQKFNIEWVTGNRNPTAAIEKFSKYPFLKIFGVLPHSNLVERIQASKFGLIFSDKESFVHKALLEHMSFHPVFINAKLNTVPFIPKDVIKDLLFENVKQIPWLYAKFSDPDKYDQQIEKQHAFLGHYFSFKTSVVDDVIEYSKEFFPPRKCDQFSGENVIPLRKLLEKQNVAVSFTFFNTLQHMMKEYEKIDTIKETIFKKWGCKTIIDKETGLEAFF